MSTDNYFAELTKAEHFALSQTLSDYPDYLTYREVQDLIGVYVDHDDPDDASHDQPVVVWELMEDWSKEDLISYQDDLKNAVEQLLKEA